MKKMGKNMLTLMIMALNILLVTGCKSTLKSSSPIITIENIEQISKIQIHAHRMDKTEYPSNKFENLIKDLENAIPLDDTEAKKVPVNDNKMYISFIYENGEKNITGASGAMAVLMMSYELYPQEYTDQEGIPESGNQIPDILDEIRYETGWFLKMQDKQTGAVYAGVTAYDKGSYVEPACAGAEFAFAMTMAKFGYLYQNYDKEYAMTCLKAADRAFKHAVLCEEADDREEKIWRFAAAAEIYRAAGQVSYQKYLVEYLSDGDLTLAGDMVQLSGCVTYISTKQAVSMVLCEKIMTMLMDQAEEISEEVRGSLYMTSTEAEGDSSRILTQAAYLTVVNHVISNYEYKLMIENQLHYLLGRNERGIDYISDDTEEAPCVINQFKEDSMLVFMLAGIVSGS